MRVYIFNTLLSLSTAIVLGVTGCGSSSDDAAASSANTTSGVAIDGLIAGATVCVDVNLNNSCDANEDNTTTNQAGEYTLTSNQKGPLYLFGGDDLGTGLPFTGSFKAPQGSKVITPLTTALQSMIENGATKEEAELSLKTAMGIPTAVNLTEYNPLKELEGTDAANAKIVLQKQAQLQIMAHGAATIIAAADETRSVQNVMDEVFEAFSAKFSQNELNIILDSVFLEDAINTAARIAYRDESVKHNAIAHKANATAQKVILLAQTTLSNIQTATNENVLVVFNLGLKSINDEVALEVVDLFTQKAQENNTSSSNQNNDTNETTGQEETPPIENEENNNSNEHTSSAELSDQLLNYYADAIDKNAKSLKSALHSIVSETAIYLTYAQAYQYLAETDKDYRVASGDNLVLFYMQTSFASELRCGSSATGCWNREHMWPKSLGVGYNESVNTYTDLHHLRPTDAGINSSRSNTPYGDATTPYSKIDGFYYDNKFEVSDTLKGEVARAILYMTVRYEGDNSEPDLEIYAGDFSDSYPAELCTMYRWHFLDAVSENERKRNDVVESYQGNRNPFVDNPQWVEDIWGDECDNVGLGEESPTQNDENTTEEPGLDVNASSGLIFSEYIEGSSYNKALELYNASQESISLGAYEIHLYSNGSSTPSMSTTLASVTLAPGETYVITHQDADTALLSLASQTSGNINHNGDDAYTLVHSSTQTVVDSVGRVGEDPGDFWGVDTLNTKDYTLRRKIAVVTGDITPNDEFVPSVEWDIYSKDSFEGLGYR